MGMPIKRERRYVARRPTLFRVAHLFEAIDDTVVTPEVFLLVLLRLFGVYLVQLLLISQQVRGWLAVVKSWSRAKD